jgi:hypothetical protein
MHCHASTSAVESTAIVCSTESLGVMRGQGRRR